MNFDTVLMQLREKGIHGLHSDRERRLLYDLAAGAKGDIVEIGSFLGHSTVIMAKALPGKATIYAIDPHIGIEQAGDDGSGDCIGDTWEKFKRNIFKLDVAARIQALKMKSEDAAVGWKQPIAVLFIDGSHYYEDVLKDFLLWRPHLMRGGTIVFHDCWQNGPRKVISEHILNDNSFRRLRLTPCCMFSAVYSHGRSTSRLTRMFWISVFKMRSSMERHENLRKNLFKIMQLAGRYQTT